MDTDRSEMIWPGDPADGSAGTSPANPLQGLTQGLGGFLGDMLGGLTGGLLPNSQGQHRGPLADAVQSLFGHDPWAAEEYKGALAPTRPAASYEPDARRPSFAAQPPRPQDPNAVAVEGAVAPTENAARAAALAQFPGRGLRPKTQEAGTVSVDEANAGRADAIEQSQTPSSDPAVTGARTRDPSSLNHSPAQIWVPRSQLDAEKPIGANTPQRERLAAPRRETGSIPQRRSNDDAGGSTVDPRIANYGGEKVSHIEAAQRFINFSEHDPRQAQALSSFFKKSGGQSLNPAETAWCAAFANAVLKESGMPGTGTLRAKDFLNYGTPTNQPTKGDIVVLHRGDPNGWQGHVGFYMGRQGDKILILGGNQGDRVSVQAFPASKLAGFRKPPQAGTMVAQAPQKYAQSAQRSFTDAYKAAYGPRITASIDPNQPVVE